MLVVKVPNIDEVVKKSELANYLKGWRVVLGDLSRIIAEDAAIIRGWSKAEDAAMGTRAAPYVTRPLWGASLATLALRKFFALVAKRFSDNYAPNVRPRVRGRLQDD